MKKKKPFPSPGPGMLRYLTRSVSRRARIMIHNVAPRVMSYCNSDIIVNCRISSPANLLYKKIPYDPPQKTRFGKSTHSKMGYHLPAPADRALYQVNNTISSDDSSRQTHCCRYVRLFRSLSLSLSPCY